MQVSIIEDPFRAGVFLGLKESADGIEVDGGHVRHLLNRGVRKIYFSLDSGSSSVYVVTEWIGPKDMLHQILAPIKPCCCLTHLANEVLPLLKLVYQRG